MLRSIACAALAGSIGACGGSSPLSPNVEPARSTTDGGLRTNWISPDARSEDLLYVSLIPGGVDVFSYPQGKRLGHLTGSEEPYGECVDAGGDVFITDHERSDIVEYRHGGREPMRKLSDPGRPLDCSVDPTSGNLAVSNTTDSRSYGLQGNVEIYVGAKGRPRKLSDADLYAAWYCAYDGKGDLFVSGQNWSLGAIYLELPRGSRRFNRLHLRGVKGHGGLMWDGRFMALSNVTRIDRIADGKIISSAELKRSYPFALFSLYRNTIVVPEGGAHQYVGSWRYPNGGLPTGEIHLQIEPAGVAVSLK